jgi:hypothetical protein
LANDKLKFIIDFIIKNKDDLEKVDKSLKELPKSTDKAKKANKGLSQAFSKAAPAITAISTAYLAVSKAIGSVVNKAKQYVSLALTQESAERKLEKQLGKNIDEWKAYASSLQGVTTVGDEATLALIQTADALGISSNQIQEATEGAIGLAERFSEVGLSQKNAMKGIALAYEGNFTQLQRYIPALRSAETEAEKMALLQKNMSEGFLLAVDSAKTSEGQIIQYQNAVGDLQEALGMIAIDGFMPFVGHLKNATEAATTFIQNKRRIAAIQEETTAFSNQALSLDYLAQKQNKTAKEKEQQISLINEIQEKYPDFLANQNAENVNYDQIATAISKINKNLEEKLILELSEQEKTKLVEKNISLRLKQQKAEKELLLQEARRNKWLKDNNLELENAASWTETQLRSFGENQKSITSLNTAIRAYKQEQSEIAGEIANIEQKYKDLLDTEQEQPEEKTISERIGAAQEQAERLIKTLENEGNPITLPEIIVPDLSWPEKFQDPMGGNYNITDLMFGSEEENKSKAQTWIENRQLEINATADLMNNLYALGKARRDREMLDEIEKAETSALTEEEKAAKISNIKEKYRKKDIAAQKMLKPIRVAQAIANTALGVTKALSMANIPLAAIIGAAGAVEVATIMAQPYAEGGVPGIAPGVLKGKSHAQGGIPLVAEGDETILTKGVYRNPFLRQQASDLNVAGGGRPFASGGSPSSTASGSSVNSVNNLLSSLLQEIVGLRMQVSEMKLSVNIITSDPKTRIIEDEETKNNMIEAGDGLENI